MIIFMSRLFSLHLPNTASISLSSTPRYSFVCNSDIPTKSKVSFLGGKSVATSKRKRNESKKDRRQQKGCTDNEKYFSSPYTLCSMLLTCDFNLLNMNGLNTLCNCANKFSLTFASVCDAENMESKSAPEWKMSGKRKFKRAHNSYTTPEERGKRMAW